MANRLMIRVVETTDLDTGETGYIILAADNHANGHSDELPSVEKFLETFPTELSMIEEVISWEGFQDCGYIDDRYGHFVADSISAVEVLGHDVLRKLADS